MKNLLKLLKQYWKETFNDKTLLRIDYEENTDCFSWIYQPAPWMKLAQWQILETPVVFSKSFGFIKYLVENDKIDRDKMLKENWLFRKYFYDLEYVKNYDRLIMWLSVSDNPIQDLILLIK